MENEELGTLEIRKYLGILRRWLWLLILATCLAAGSAYVAGRLSTPIYEASATLLVSEGERVSGPDYSAILLSERLTKTYSQLLKSRPILDEVEIALGISLEGVEITVDPVRDTQLIRLRVRHADPDTAAAIANTIPLIFSQRNEALQAARFATSQESLSREMDALQKEMAAAESAMQAERAKPSANAAEGARLEALLAQYRSTYAGLLQSYEEIRVAEARGFSTITVAEPAVVPGGPVLPRTRTNTLLAGVVGAMLAVGTAFLIEYLDDTIKSPEDVERAAQLPTFANITLFPSADTATQWPLMARQASSGAAEGYRVLRTNLQFATLGLGGSAVTLLVTSAQPEEGKTTTLANLGVSLAQAGKSVVLVDADLRRPSLHRQFGLQNKPGLTSLLLGAGADPERVLQDTGIKGLRLLTTGHLPASTAEVLDSPAFTALLAGLRPLADYVLLDSPPLLSVADPTILAQKVDGVLLVAEMGRTRTDLFARAVASLQGVKARVVGVVLNKVVVQPGSYYYDYYYSYYGHYGNGDANGKGKRKHRRRRRGLFGKLFGGHARPAAPTGTLNGEDVIHGTR